MYCVIIKERFGTLETNYRAVAGKGQDLPHVQYIIVFHPDKHYRNDDGLIKQKMGLQSKQVMKLTVPEI